MNDEMKLRIFKIAEYMKDNSLKYGLDADKMYLLGLVHKAYFPRTGYERDIAVFLKSLNVDKNMANAAEYQNFTPSQYMEKFKITDVGIPNELILLWEANAHYDEKGKYIEYKGDTETSKWLKEKLG